MCRVAPRTHTTLHRKEDKRGQGRALERGARHEPAALPALSPCPVSASLLTHRGERGGGAWQTASHVWAPLSLSLVCGAPAAAPLFLPPSPPCRLPACLPACLRGCLLFLPAQAHRGGRAHCGARLLYCYYYYTATTLSVHLRQYRMCVSQVWQYRVVLHGRRGERGREEEGEQQQQQQQRREQQPAETDGAAVVAAGGRERHTRASATAAAQARSPSRSSSSNSGTGTGTSITTITTTTATATSISAGYARTLSTVRSHLQATRSPSRPTLLRAPASAHAFPQHSLRPVRPSLLRFQASSLSRARTEGSPSVSSDFVSQHSTNRRKGASWPRDCRESWRLQCTVSFLLRSAKHQPA